MFTKLFPSLHVPANTRLFCWKYYNFTIRANASILQDLKWEQRSQTQSNIQWY